MRDDVVQLPCDPRALGLDGGGVALLALCRWVAPGSRRR
jgi:hypothetical protein